MPKQVKPRVKEELHISYNLEGFFPDDKIWVVIHAIEENDKTPNALKAIEGLTDAAKKTFKNMSTEFRITKIARLLTTTTEVLTVLQVEKDIDKIVDVESPSRRR